MRRSLANLEEQHSLLQSGVGGQFARDFAVRRRVVVRDVGARQATDKDDSASRAEIRAQHGEMRAARAHAVGGHAELHVVNAACAIGA